MNLTGETPFPWHRPKCFCAPSVDSARREMAWDAHVLPAAVAPLWGERGICSRPTRVEAVLTLLTPCW